MTALWKLDPFHESGDALPIGFSCWGKSIREPEAERVLPWYQESSRHRELDVFPLIGERRGGQNLVVEHHGYYLGREAIRCPCGDNRPQVDWLFQRDTHTRFGMEGATERALCFSATAAAPTVQQVLSTRGSEVDRSTSIEPSIKILRRKDLVGPGTAPLTGNPTEDLLTG